MFEVWDINAEALSLFLAVQSQWRMLAVAGLGGGKIIWQGLDYVAVDVLMRRGQIDDPDGRLFSDLVLMEDAALAAFAEAVP